eukprot:Skav213631  [mRNA]  locus=scaffold2012:18066:19755:- [translate_table: standard]
MRRSSRVRINNITDLVGRPLSEIVQAIAASAEKPIADAADASNWLLSRFRIHIGGDARSEPDGSHCRDRSVRGILTDLERPDKVDPYKRAKIRKATFTHLPGISALMDLTGLAHHLPDVFLGMPSGIAAMKTKVECQLAGLYKIGSTVSGSQLLRVASLAPQNRPLALGIRTQVDTPPYVAHRQQELLASFRLLFSFLLSGTVPEALANYQPFAEQFLREAQTDSGHFILLASGILASSLSGREYLAVEGLFRAGKTTSVVLLFAWLILTTPTAVKFTIASRENPTSQAIAKQLERLALPPAVRQWFVRACSGRTSVARRLIEFGAGLNYQAPPLPRSWLVSRDEHRDPWWAGQETALHFASGRGHLHTVHLLITFKAHLTILDGRGCTWLQVATGSVSILHQAFLDTTSPERTSHSRS